MNYRCLKNQTFTHGDYSIIPIREQDLNLIMEWRNAQMDILRQNHVLTQSIQHQYYQSVLLPAFSQTEPNQILFSFFKNNSCIGYGGIVHIDWFSKRGEVSFLVETLRSHNPKQYREDFGAYLSLIKEVAYKELHFHRIFTETFDIRPVHVEVLESNGFTYEGRLKDHVLINGKFVDSLMHGCLLNGVKE